PLRRDGCYAGFRTQCSARWEVSCTAMLANTAEANVLIDQYRCPEHYGTFGAGRKFDDLITDLRFERYVKRSRSLISSLAQDAYYAFRPLMPVAFRKHLHRIYLRRWREISFPSWPV